MMAFVRYAAFGVAALGLVACTSAKKEEGPAATPASAMAAPAPVATPAPAPEVAPAPAPAPVQELVLETIYFDFDSYSLTPAAQETLRTAATAMRANAAVKVQIEGHCDERGSNEYNLALGERRARAVKEFLSAEGVANDALSTISYGEEKPAVQGTGEEAWAKNRRVDFKKL